MDAHRAFTWFLAIALAAAPAAGALCPMNDSPAAQPCCCGAPAHPQPESCNSDEGSDPAGALRCCASPGPPLPGAPAAPEGASRVDALFAAYLGVLGRPPAPDDLQAGPALAASSVAPPSPPRTVLLCTFLC